MTLRDMAVTLIQAVQNELKLGTKHWDQDGKPLTTVKEIVHALQIGHITIEPVESRKNLFKGYTL